MTYQLPAQRWHHHQSDAIVNAIVPTDLPPLMVKVLAARGLATAKAIEVFLDPDVVDLPSPLQEFKDLALAVNILATAISSGQKIAICGDYDADGMTSTALLLRVLRLLGAQASYVIPSRMSEGYGINQRIVEEAHRHGFQIILTVDNGISAYEPIALAQSLGLTVLVTDHHDLPSILPPADVILNPKLLDQSSPYRGLAGVGVAYVLAVCLVQSLSRKGMIASLLELFTLGTIADLAPLTGVNRRWVRRGLKLLSKSVNPGIQALIAVSGLGEEKDFKPEAIGFRIAPRINAIGRISDPQIVIELLTTDDPQRASELALQCEQVNQQRQLLCQQIEQEAVAICDQDIASIYSDRVLVLIQPDWHHGVIGIVASRLVDRYGVPVFIGTYEADGSVVRGSARSIPEFDVFAALEFCDDQLLKYGGHQAAGGFSLSSEHVIAFQQRLSLFACQQLQLEDLKPLVKIDAQANFDDLTLAFYQQLQVLQPCGIANPEPVFWTPNLEVVAQQIIGSNRDHLKITLQQQNGSQLKAIAWRWGCYHSLPDRVDVAYRLCLNQWKGQSTVELNLVGVRPAINARGIASQLPQVVS